MKVTFTLNGEARSIDIVPGTPLLWVLRDQLEMTGTKFGCGRALCGACTIHVDGNAVRSCAFPADLAEGRDVTTIEGLEESAVGKAVIESWIDLDVVQCGYCQPGQCMGAAALLAKNDTPNDAAIDAALSGNICRCGAYPRIRKAVHEAAARLEKGSSR